MFGLVTLLCCQDGPVVRTSAVYRCPASEATTDRMKKLVEDDLFDSVCVDPKPPALTLQWMKGKLKSVKPSVIDTAANLKWRNATIEFAAGRISPAEWVSRTKNLHETYHFLSSPRTKTLRDEMMSVPVLPGGTYSARSVFAEMFVLSLPGTPCFTSSDVWKTRELPEPGRLQSWVLAMNDFLGPLLYYRYEHAFMVLKKPRIVRADKQPGLLVFVQSQGHKTLTFYLNNSNRTIELPPLDVDKVIINHGLDLEGQKPAIVETGFLIEDSDGR